MLFILLSCLTILSTISIFHTEIRCVWVFSGCWYWKDICYQRHCWYNHVIILILILISSWSALLNFFLVWLELLNFQSHDPLGFLRNAVKDNKPAARVGPLVALQPEINLFYIVVIPLMVQISQNVTVFLFFSKKKPQTTPSWTWRYFSLTDTTGNECCRVTLNCHPNSHQPILYSPWHLPLTLITLEHIWTSAGILSWMMEVCDCAFMFGHF